MGKGNGIFSMSSILEPPPPTQWNVLSFGAGVQSSAMALMAQMGHFEVVPDFCVFSDTGSEPQEVYDWLEYMQVILDIPIYTVSRGNLEADSLTVKVAEEGHERVNNLIPLFGIKPNGEKTAAIGRKCTNDYKILPIIQKVRELCGIKRGQKEVTVTMWMGISWDEIQRVKDPRFPWIQHRYPLIERKMTRQFCERFVEENFHKTPPRSACYFCPFHSDTEWRRLRDKHPVEFARAIKFDADIRRIHKDHNKRLNMEVYLHPSCLPLEQVDFDNDEDKGQQVWDFNAECEGMCGL